MTKCAWCFDLLNEFIIVPLKLLLLFLIGSVDAVEIKLIWFFEGCIVLEEYFAWVQALTVTAMHWFLFHACGIWIHINALFFVSWVGYRISFSSDWYLFFKYLFFVLIVQPRFPLLKLRVLLRVFELVTYLLLIRVDFTLLFRWLNYVIPL